MKKEVIVVFGVFSLYLTSYSLQYIESSSGLIPPTLEGGRTEIEMADINNDGNLDLLSIGDHGSPYINSDQHGIMVWFGDGQGNWRVYMNGNFGYGGIAVGDVNNDGYLDCGYGMHHNYSSNDFGDQVMEVALGDGTGRNWTPWDDSLGMHGQDWGMFGTDFGDVDNDGDLDIGSISFGADDGIHIYLNQRDGTWRRSFGFIGGNSNMDFIFGDINRDGFLDFASAHQYGSVYLGNGQGSFTQANRNLPPPGSNNAYRSVDLGDVDNDGGMDLGFITPQGAVSVWSFNEAGDTWVNFSGDLPRSGNYRRIQLFDMDTDGFLDVIAQVGCTLKIWLGNGQGVWYETLRIITSPSSGYSQALRVGGDCDHNGYPDIATVINENNRNRFRFFKETSQPTDLSIKPLFPRGGEKFIGNSINFIKWISAVPNNQTSTVRIEFSSQGPTGPWTTIYHNLQNNGLKQWRIPNSPSNNCYLRFSVSTPTETAFVITPRPFTILGSTFISELSLIKEEKKNLPTTYLIAGAVIRIPIFLSNPGQVSIKTYGINGRIIYSEERRLDAKAQILELRDYRLADGIYFLYLTSPEINKKIKIIKLTSTFGKPKF